MTNLLANPTLWTFPPGPGGWAWNGTSYVYDNATAGSNGFTLSRNGAWTPAQGDTYVGQASTAFTASPRYLNLVNASGVVVHSLLLTATPQRFNWNAYAAGPDVSIVLAATATSNSAVTAANQTLTITPDEAISYNCECDQSIVETDTLLNIRRRLLRRLGFAAQATNPPPGMAALLDDFIVSGQRLLYNRYSALRQSRIFSWNLTPGVRFYDITANRGLCRHPLDPRRIEWAGISDGESNWTPIVYGVRPEWYTSPQSGRPFAYEVRQCIELWPYPSSENYVLRIKGDMGLMPLAEDSDETSIDAEAVFLQALATAKAHYKHADATVPADLLRAYLRDKTAASHGTARYLPGGQPLLNHPLPRKEGT